MSKTDSSVSVVEARTNANRQVEDKRRGDSSSAVDGTVWLLRAGLLIGVLVAWEIFSRTFGWEILASRPLAIGERLVSFTTDARFYENLRVTMVQTVIGFLIGTTSGFAVGIATGAFERLGAILDPFFHFLNSVPRIALAPLFVLWLGFGMASKIAVIISIIFFVMVVNATAGVRNVDPDLVLAARILGADRRTVVRTVVLPSILVWLFPAVRLCVAYSFLGVVIGEFVGAQAGLGFYILLSANYLDTTGVIAAIVVLALLSVTAIGLVDALERRVLRWQPKKERFA